MNLEQISETYRIMRDGIGLGIFLRNRGITGENISNFPSIKNEFDFISCEGRRAAKEYSPLAITLGIFGAFVKDPIKFAIADRYIQNKVLPYYRYECNC